MTPVNGHRLTICSVPLGEVPESIQRNTGGGKRREDVKVADKHNTQENFGRKADVVVGEDTDVQAEDRQLGKGHAQNVDDGADDADLDLLISGQCRAGAGPSLL